VFPREFQGSVDGRPVLPTWVNRPGSRGLACQLLRNRTQQPENSLRQREASPGRAIKPRFTVVVARRQADGIGRQNVAIQEPLSRLGPDTFDAWKGAQEMRDLALAAAQMFDREAAE
jgi:hypothetical protein